MAAVSTSNACKAVVQDAAIEVTANDLPHIGPEKAILPGKALIVDLFQRFKVVLNALIIQRGGVKSLIDLPVVISCGSGVMPR